MCNVKEKCTCWVNFIFYNFYVYLCKKCKRLSDGLYSGLSVLHVTEESQTDCWWEDVCVIPCLLFNKLQTWFTKEPGVGVSFVVLGEIRYKKTEMRDCHSQCVALDSHAWHKKMNLLAAANQKCACFCVSSFASRQLWRIFWATKKKKKLNTVYFNVTRASWS